MWPRSRACEITMRHLDFQRSWMDGRVGNREEDCPLEAKVDSVQEADR